VASSRAAPGVAAGMLAYRLSTDDGVTTLSSRALTIIVGTRRVERFCEGEKGASGTAAFRAGRVRTFDPWGWRPAAGEEDADWRQAARTGSLWLKNLFVRS